MHANIAKHRARERGTNSAQLLLLSIHAAEVCAPASCSHEWHKDSIPLTRTSFRHIYPPATSTARLTTCRPTSSLTSFPHRPGLATEMMIADRRIALGLLSLSVGACLLVGVHTERAPTIRARPCRAACVIAARARASPCAASVHGVPGISFLKPDEQLVLYSPSKISVVNGPRVATYIPGISRGVKRKALQLSETEYAKIKDTLTGNDTIVKGPTLHFLGPYDKLTGTARKIVLTDKQCACPPLLCH